jgi:hypothetical protein
LAKTLDKITHDDVLDAIEAIEAKSAAPHASRIGNGLHAATPPAGGKPAHSGAVSFMLLDEAG